MTQTRQSYRYRTNLASIQMTQTRQRDKYRTDLASMQEDKNQTDKATDIGQTPLKCR